MERDDFKKAIIDFVQEYIDNFDRFDSNPQIRINPETLYVRISNGSDLEEDIEDSDEVIENAAYAEGDETESSSDFQAKQNPDFYPVKELLKKSGEHTSVPDLEKIEAITAQYFK